MKLQTVLIACIVSFCVHSTLFSQQAVKTVLEECKTIGKELHVKFLLTNNSEVEKLFILLADAKLFDGIGNAFTAARIELGEQTKTYGAVSEECPKEIPIKLKIVFKDAPSKLNDIKRLHFFVKEYGNDKSHEMKFEDISVPTTDDERVQKAFEDPYYFETEDGVFVKLIKASKNQKLVTAEFTVENTNFDKKVNYNFNDTRIIDDLGNVSKVKSMTFGNTVKTYGGVSQTLPQNVPVKLILHFESVDPSLSVLKVLELGSIGNVFQLKDINL